MGSGELLRARKRLGQFNKELKNFDESEHPVVHITSQEAIDMTRRFLVAAYRDRKTVSEHLVDPETNMYKPGIEIGLDRSDCFYVPGDTVERPVEVSARLIHAIDGQPDSMQMHVDELSPRWQTAVNNLPLDKTVEVASLARAKNISTVTVLHLMRTMLHYSHENDIRYWVWGMKRPIADSYKRMFGDLITEMDPSVECGNLEYKYVPLLVNVEDTIERLRNPNWRERIMGKTALFAFMSQPSDALLEQE